MSLFGKTTHNIGNVAEPRSAEQLVDAANQKLGDFIAQAERLSQGPGFFSKPQGQEMLSHAREAQQAAEVAQAGLQSNVSAAPAA
jgi:hypothetical protein